MIIDVKCKNEECGKIEERLVKRDAQLEPCNACGCDVEKQLSTSTGISVTGYSAANNYGLKSGGKKI